MRFVTPLAVLLLVNACATAKIEHPTTMMDTGWIQRGSTTRDQIETRFGSPNFEVPEYAGSTRPTTAMTAPRVDKDIPKTTSTVTPSPKETKATYLQPQASAEMAPSSAKVQDNDDRFWVTYDADDVVRDFGFAGPPAH